MTPIQQLMLGVGAKKKVFLDDVFSTYLYTGNATARSINNGVDMSKGGITWIKSRSHTLNGNIFSSDLVDGSGTYGCLQTTDSDAAGYSNTGSNAMLTAFNNNGFSLGADGATYRVNGGTLSGSAVTYSSWTFRKAPGFFDVVTYTGNGSARTISHNLGCVPGMIIVKRLDSSGDWMVYHSRVGQVDGTQFKLNSTGSAGDFGNVQYDVSEINSTHFGIGSMDAFNANGGSFVAYLWAGGESTAATARSVDFDGNSGNGECIFAANNTAWDIGSVDCTLECWVNFKSHNSHDGIFHNIGNSGWNGGGWVMEPVGGVFHFYYINTGGTTGNVAGAKIPLGQWQHIAVTKSGSTIKIYQDGLLTGSGTINGTIRDATNSLKIGGQCFGADMDGKVSNVRITRGQVLYTSSFRPSTVPLTTTSQGATASNVKLLCCNNSSITGSTVTAGTINSFGSPTASTDSPFDDPAGFAFGENEDQNVVKCGSYEGNGSSTGPEIYLGWEPEFLMIKRTDSTGNWQMYDSMRGIVSDGDDARLNPNNNNAEAESEKIDLTPTGFKVKTSDGETNASGSPIIYLAIRRPDGYCGKQYGAGEGTDVFTMDTGSSSSTIPEWDSSFPVDFGMFKKTNASQDWYASARLIQDHVLYPNTSNDEDGYGDAVFDSNLGWGKSAGGTYGSNYISYMWKRHAGFDLVAYEGNSTSGRQLPHSLNNTIEMIWLKNRSQSDGWMVYHKGVNGGTNPEQYYMYLNDTASPNAANTIWNDTAPNSTHFTVGNHDFVNKSNENYIAMLFASVDGISKVGSYTGNSGTISITTGFQPRLLIIKNITWAHGGWSVFDTTRALGSSNDYLLYINATQAQQTNQDFGDISSTGFSMGSGDFAVNANNHNFIYYAHA